MALTNRDVLTFLPKCLWIFLRLSLNTLFAPLRSGRARSKTFGVYIRQRWTQALFYILTAGQIQFIFPVWLAAYKAQMRKSQKPTAVDNVPNTQIQGVWFGDANTATTIMVYYPGGGHVIPGLAIHAAALDRWTSWCQGRLAIFAIQYSLAPAVMYPTAIGESVEAVRFVLQGPGKGKEIMVGGDSAGGQIALAVMSHLGGHPHPDVYVVRPLDLQGGKVKGVVLLSPWTSSDTARFASITELSGVDIIGPTAIKYWSGLYQGSKPDDPYIVPEMADANWWMGVGEVTQSIFVSYGQDESFKDAITSWARKFQQGVGNDKVRVVAGENEGHNGPLGLLPERELAAEIFGHEKSAEGALRYWLLSLVGLM